MRESPMLIRIYFWYWQWRWSWWQPLGSTFFIVTGDHRTAFYARIYFAKCALSTINIFCLYRNEDYFRWICWNLSWNWSLKKEGFMRALWVIIEINWVTSFWTKQKVSCWCIVLVDLLSGWNLNCGFGLVKAKILVPKRMEIVPVLYWSHCINQIWKNLEFIEHVNSTFW